MEISISKEVLPTLEEFGFEETLLGDPMGSLRQYRNSSGLHVREYEDRFVIHRDTVDPRINPIGHLLRDTAIPISLGVSLFGAKGRDESESSSFRPTKFLLSFLMINSLIRLLRRLL